MKFSGKGVLISTAALSFALFSGAALAQEYDIEHTNVKMKMDGTLAQEFVAPGASFYSYATVSEGKPNFSIKDGGKNGRCFAVDYIAHKNNTYSALVAPFPPYSPQNSDMLFGTAIKGTKKFCFYAKVDPIPELDGLNRTLNLGVRVNNASGSGSASYLTTVTIPNTGEWAYYAIDTADLKSGSNTLADQEGWEERIDALMLHLHAGLHANSKDVYAQKGVDFFTAPVYLDEIMFVKGTGSDYFTPPSAGEDAYALDASVASIDVGGKLFDNLKGKSRFDITVPKGMSNALLMEQIKINLGSPEFEGSATEQIKSGGTYTFEPPSSIPGVGTISTVSGNRLIEDTFEVAISYRNDIYARVTEIAINGEQGELQLGPNSYVIAATNDAAVGKNIGAIVIVNDKETLKPSTMEYSNIFVQPGETDYIYLYSYITDLSDNTMVTIFVVNELAAMNSFEKVIVK